jgi:hypothetical protein
VRHRVDERDERNIQPGHVPVALRLVVTILAAGLATGGCGAAPARQTAVMVSGRDDHGLLARPAIGFQRSPTDATIVGSAQDGTFVTVLREDRSWLLVRTLVAPIEEGWVNDHDLRGVGVLDGHAQVRFRGARQNGGGVEVLVIPVEGGEERWVDAGRIREVGAS